MKHLNPHEKSIERKFNTHFECKQTPSTKESSTRDFKSNFFNYFHEFLILESNNIKGKWISQPNIIIKGKGPSSRGQSRENINDLKVPEIRFASQGRKKRGGPIIFRK